MRASGEMRILVMTYSLYWKFKKKVPITQTNGIYFAFWTLFIRLFVEIPILLVNTYHIAGFAAINCSILFNFNLMVIRCSTISTFPMRMQFTIIHIIPVEWFTCVLFHKFPLDETMKHEQERQCHWILELLLLFYFVDCAQLMYGQ